MQHHSYWILNVEVQEMIYLFLAQPHSHKRSKVWLKHSHRHLGRDQASGPKIRDVLTWAQGSRSNLLQLEFHRPTDAVVFEAAQDVLLGALQLVDFLQMDIITIDFRIDF